MDQAEIDKRVAWLDRHIHEQILVGHPGDAELRALVEFLGRDDHRIRHLETYLRVRPFLVPASREVYETGNPGALTKFLRKTGRTIGVAKGDLRYAIELPDGCADVLFSFEVLEHIKDQEPRTFGDVVLFNFSGVRQFIAEMRRVLRPGGMVLLTTPNATSMHSLVQILEGRNPMIFYPHVKEYAPADVIGLFEAGGFTLKRFEAFTSFFLLNDASHAVRKYFSDLGHSTENRGDTSFFAFEKA